MKALKRTTMTGAESSICEAETAYMSNPPSDYSVFTTQIPQPLTNRGTTPAFKRDLETFNSHDNIKKKQKTHFIC